MSASTNYGDRRGNNVTILIVSDRPSTAVTHTSPWKPTEGGSMTLTCDITDGNPLDEIKQVTWKNGDKTLSSAGRFQLSDNNKVLTISSLNHTVDDGQYSCAAENKAGTGDFSAKFHLQIHYKPVVSVVMPDPVVEGQSVTITCQSQGARPAVDKVTWKKGQEFIDVTCDTRYKGGTVHSQSLTIGSVLKTDAGEYTCQLSNDVGHGTASVTLQVLYKPNGQATVEPQDVTVAVNGQVSLTCRAPSDSGNPAASWFTWSKDNSDFSSNTTDALRLTPSSVTESSKYRCKAGNWIGQSDYSEWTTVTVQAPAKVEYPSSDDIIKTPAFDDLHFNMTCTVSGSGDPMVQWRKDGVSVDTGDFAVTSVLVTGGHYMYGQTEAMDSTLIWQVTKRARYFTCNNITHFDGHYTCAVSTQTAGATTGDEFKAFIVNVQYETHWSSGPKVIAAAPNDTSKEIVCSVCANPQPTFLWTFKNETLREGIHVDRNKIVLDLVARDDFGVYQCMANSSINGESRTAVFKVTLVESGPAREPLNFTILSYHTSVALTLRWRPGFHGGHPPQTFTLQYRASNKVTLRIWTDLFNHTTDRVTWYQATVTGLQSQTEYVFSLYAENSRPRDKGPNRSETITQTGSTTASPQVKLESVKLTESQMTVTWSYTWQTMRRKRSTSPSVSVVIYYQPADGDEAHYPPEGSVAAEEREVTISGKFDVKAKYKVWLKVYEGGFVSVQRTEPLDAAVEQVLSNPPLAIIAGSAAAVVVILIILIIGVLLCRRHAKNKGSNTANTAACDPIPEETTTHAYYNTSPSDVSDNKDYQTLAEGHTLQNVSTREGTYTTIDVSTTTKEQPYEDIDSNVQSKHTYINAAVANADATEYSEVKATMEPLGHHTYQNTTAK